MLHSWCLFIGFNDSSFYFFVNNDGCQTLTLDNGCWLPPTTHHCSLLLWQCQGAVNTVLATLFDSYMATIFFDNGNIIGNIPTLKNWHKKAVKKTNEGKPGQLQTRNWVEIRMPLQCIPHPSHLLDLRNLVLKIQISLMLKQTKWQLWISMQITNVAQLTVASNLVTGIYQVKHSYGSC